MMPAGLQLKTDAHGNEYYEGGLVRFVKTPDGRWCAAAVLQFARRDFAGKIEFYSRPMAGVVGLGDTRESAYVALKEHQFKAITPDAKPGDWKRWQAEMQKEKNK